MFYLLIFTEKVTIGKITYNSKALLDHGCYGGDVYKLVLYLLLLLLLMFVFVLGIVFRVYFDTFTFKVA